MAKELTDSKSYLRIIYVVSALIPLVVTFLILFPTKLSFAGEWIKLLPGIHATINSLTALILVCALIAIRKGNVKLHRAFMFSALFMGVLFLVSYIIYHIFRQNLEILDSNMRTQYVPALSS